MPKVLIIIASLSKKGGAEKVAAYQSQLGDNFAVSYLLFYDSQQEHPVNGKVFRLREPAQASLGQKFLKLFRRAQAIKRLCQEEQIDICISHMEESSLPLLLSRYLGNKAKTVVCLHNNPVSKYSQVFVRIISWLYRKADCLVGVSANLIQELPSRAKLQPKYRTIYNAVDLAAIKHQLDKGPNPAREGFSLVTIGRLHPQKNQALLIEAMAKLPSDIRLTILGEGPRRPNLEKLIKKHRLEKRVTLAGFQENIYPYLKEAQAFVFSSNYEGFGLVLVEAMAAGLPVISTDCPFGPKEILTGSITEPAINECRLTDYGILTPASDLPQMVEAVLYLYGHPEAQKMYHEKALLRAKDFDLPVILTQWREVLSSM